MNPIFHRVQSFTSPVFRLGTLIFSVLLFLFSMSGAKAASLFWNASADRVDARLELAPLNDVLIQIATRTGWQIYLEPGAQKTISATFSHVTQEEALKLILQDLNFALFPQTKGSAKLYIFKKSIRDATEPLALPAPVAKGGKGSVVPHEILVALKPNSAESIEDLARRLGAKITGRIDGSKLYRLEFGDDAATQAARAALASDSNVAAAEANYVINQPTEAAPMSISSQLPFLLKPKEIPNSGQVIIGLVDTAVQPLDLGMQRFVLPGLSLDGSQAASSPTPDHGTSMAETMLRSLAQTTTDPSGSIVRIQPVDVYGGNSSTTTFAVAQGVTAAINAGASVINLSLGGDGDSSFLDSLIQQAHQQGVLFFAAAGNEPTTAATYPAAYPEVVAVTAADRSGAIASYANRGPFVDVGAPGTSLVQYGGNSFLVSGTSPATAFVSGIAAGLRASGLSPADAEASIRKGMAITVPPPK